MPIRQRGGGSRRHEHTGAPSTIKQLIGSGTGIHGKPHNPGFDKILPQTMRDLVARGFFVADSNVEGGYRITKAGLDELARRNKEDK